MGDVSDWFISDYKWVSLNHTRIYMYVLYYFCVCVSHLKCYLSMFFFFFWWGMSFHMYFVSIFLYFVAIFNHHIPLIFLAFSLVTVHYFSCLWSYFFLFQFTLLWHLYFYPHLFIFFFFISSSLFLPNLYSVVHFIFFYFLISCHGIFLLWNLFYFQDG